MDGLPQRREALESNGHHALLRAAGPPPRIADEVIAARAPSSTGARPLGETRSTPLPTRPVPPAAHRARASTPRMPSRVNAMLDFDAATVHVNAIVMRVDGVGLQIQPRTKTAGSERILALPRPIVDLIRHRLRNGHPPGPAGVVFTSPKGLIRDPSNTQADLRQAMDRICYPWVTSHIFRNAVASRLDDEGFSIRQIANELGHSRPSTTLDFYLGRRAVTTADFADALEPLVNSTSE